MTSIPTGDSAQKPKAFSYLRFSTPEQMQGDSLRRQMKLTRDYAARHGLDLDEDLTFSDLGVSAYRSGNKEVGKLSEFLEAVRVGLVPKGSYLLVESLDRVSRDHTVLAQHLLQNMIIDGGITVVTLLDERVFSLEGLKEDPMGLMYSILGFMRAHEESEVKSRRLSEAWIGKRAKADTVPLTSRAPAWLRLDRENRSFVLIPERAELVQRIFAMTLEGIGQHKIAETFTREGIAPWGRARHWQRSYIAKVLANPAVIGIMTPHRMEHQGGQKRRVPLDAIHDYFPAVVSEETFRGVQALQEARAAPTRGRHASRPLTNILAGLAACPRCGQTMTRTNKGRKGVPSFVCTAAKAGAGCEYKSVRYEMIERRLLAVLPGVISDREGIERSEELEAQVGNLEDIISARRDDIEYLTDQLLEERSPALAARLRRLEEGLPEMEAELRMLRDHRDLAAGPVVGSRIERAVAALQIAEDGNLDRQEANVALRGLFKRAVINWPEGTVDLEWNTGGTCRVHYGWTGGP